MLTERTSKDGFANGNHSRDTNFSSMADVVRNRTCRPLSLPPIIRNNRHAELTLGFARRRDRLQRDRHRNTASSRCRNTDRLGDFAIREFVDDGKLLSVPKPLIRHDPCRHGFVVPKLLVPADKNVSRFRTRFILRLNT